MAGKYFDEWTVGDRLEHEIRRTVTETDNLLFSTMTLTRGRCTSMSRRPRPASSGRSWSTALSRSR